MPIDSRDKRFSMMLYDTLGRVFPAPDGTISTADRIQWIGKYRGIAFAAATVSAGDSFIPVIRRRRR